MRGKSAFRSIATILVAVAIVAQVARILSLGGRNDTTPFFSANDRSRWCTVASLVEDGCYEIDRVIQLSDDGKRRPWYTIDMVRHVGRDGQLHYYSSKPPLLATLYAGVYACIYYSTGIKLTEHPFYVGRIILIVVNLLPLAWFWWWASRWIEREVRGTWARVVFLSFVLFGTFLTTFASTMNNHLPGALAVAASMAIWFRFNEENSPSWLWTATAGAAAAFAATCDLPALSWFGMLGLLFWKQRGIASCVPYVIGAIPIAIAFFVTNWLAHGELRPAYAHRGVGKPIAASRLESPEQSDAVAILREELTKAGIELSESLVLQKAARQSELWELLDEAKSQRFAIVERQGKFEICHWDDWYDYPGSYWLEGKPKGVDRGEPSHAVYIFHSLVGHHGIFSLTPFWLLSVVGWFGFRRVKSGSDRDLMWAIAVVTIVCLAFYWCRPLIDRNYGGVSSGLRWAFWMIPLWLYPALRGVE